jgi:hypothetical protein
MIGGLAAQFRGKMKRKEIPDPPTKLSKILNISTQNLNISLILFLPQKLDFYNKFL